MNLRRITTHGDWIPEIDSLRFIAIASTLLIHILDATVTQSGLTFSPRLTSVMRSGSRGVPLFFAISGFILAQPFLRQYLLHGQPASIKSFYRRRLTRLEPPYILSLLLYAASMAVHHPFKSLVLPLFSHILYVHNFTTLKTLNFVTWSLEVEVQFYILAPLLGCLYAIPSTVVRRGIIVSLILSSAIFQNVSHGVAARSLPGQLQFFLIGFLIADFRSDRSKSTTSRWWDIVSLASWIAIFATPARYIAFSLPALIFLAYLAVFNGPISRQIFRTRWIALTGGMCYSFYLMHMLVIDSAVKITRRFLIPSNLPLSFLIQIVLLGSCIYIFCTGYFVLIERPCMDPRWPRKVIARLSDLFRPAEAVPSGEGFLD
jgi:peptidoglycan/LPS O-acetylase OafA/YrhL